MTSFADLKRVMDSLNGYLETGGASGHDGNVTKIWAELQPSLQGQPWCAATDCYIWKHAGYPYPAIDHPWGFSYCPDAVQWAKMHGLWDASGHYAPGDTVFYSFDGTGVAEHTGTVVSDDGRTILAFEGNTSPDGGFGSQADGGGAFHRHRPHGSSVLGVLKSSRWLGSSPQPHPAPTPTRHTNPYKFDPHGLPTYLNHNTDDTKWVQWALSVLTDGQFGPATDKACRLFQRVHGLAQDGVVGPRTAAALMKVTH